MEGGDFFVTTNGGLQKLCLIHHVVAKNDDDSANDSSMGELPKQVYEKEEERVFVKSGCLGIGNLLSPGLQLQDAGRGGRLVVEFVNLEDGLNMIVLSLVWWFLRALGVWNKSDGCTISQRARESQLSKFCS